MLHQMTSTSSLLSEISYLSLPMCKAPCVITAQKLYSWSNIFTFPPKCQILMKQNLEGKKPYLRASFAPTYISRSLQQLYILRMVHTFSLQGKSSMVSETNKNTSPIPQNHAFPQG